VEQLVKSINANNAHTITLAKLSAADVLEAYKIKASMREVNSGNILFTTLEHFILYPLLSGSKVTA